MSIYIIFDIDGTLMGTKSGKTFPRDEDDFEVIWRPVIPKNVPSSSSSSSSSGQRASVITYIHTNQSGALSEICGKKVKAAVSLVSAVDKIVAREDDEDRKPVPFGLISLIYGDDGKYDKATDERRKDVIIFVGDAAGRDGDHSDTDLKVALNLRRLGYNAHFTTPEEYGSIDFTDRKKMLSSLKAIKKASTWTVTYPDLMAPQESVDDGNAVKIFDAAADVPGDVISLSLILMCGIQGSGKSTIVSALKDAGWTILPYKAKDKTLRDAKRLIGSGKRVVVDGTFPTHDTRALFTTIVKEGAALIIHVTTPPDLAHHNRKYREIIHGAEKIPTVAVRRFNAAFEKPSKSLDGCRVIRRRAFVNDAEDVAYQLYYY